MVEVEASVFRGEGRELAIQYTITSAKRFLGGDYPKWCRAMEGAKALPKAGKLVNKVVKANDRRFIVQLVASTGAEPIGVVHEAIKKAWQSDGLMEKIKLNQNGVVSALKVEAKVAEGGIAVHTPITDGMGRPGFHSDAEDWDNPRPSEGQLAFSAARHQTVVAMEDLAKRAFDAMTEASRALEVAEKNVKALTLTRDDAQAEFNRLNASVEILKGKRAP